MANMTNSDKTSSSSLTEEVYAQSIGAASIPTMPDPLPWFEVYLEKRLYNVPWYKRSAQMVQWIREEYEKRLQDDEIQHDKYCEWFEGFRKWRREMMYKNAAGKNQHQLGPREFTLTYTDAWYQDDTDAQNAMRCAVEKLSRYYKNEIIEFHAIGEFTRAGRSHVHGWYHLTGGRKITDKNFKRAWPHWNPKRKLGKGFEGGHHENIQRVSDFAGYAEKHLEEAWLEIHINNANEKEDSGSSSPSSHGSSHSSVSSLEV